MGLEGIAPGPSTSKPQPGHKVYPYLLKTSPSSVRTKPPTAEDKPAVPGCSDITYVALHQRVLAGCSDGFSRHVLSWRLSNSMEVEFCLEVLDDAFALGAPEIFNTDQGAQFTSRFFTERLQSKSIEISMDGRGRALDNVFIERLWRSVKYEDIYLKGYDSDKCHLCRSPSAGDRLLVTAGSDEGESGNRNPHQNNVQSEPQRDLVLLRV